MTDTSSVSKKIHLDDWTLKNQPLTACGIVDDDKLTPGQFAKSDPTARCKMCERELRDSRLYQLKCRICGEAFESKSDATNHEFNSHDLMMVSGRNETPCFVLKLQGQYNSVHLNALKLSRARLLLKRTYPFSGYKFDFIPARMVLQNIDTNSTLLAVAYVAEYHVVAR